MSYLSYYYLFLVIISISKVYSKLYQFSVIAFVDRNTTTIGVKINNNNHIINLNDADYPIWKGEYNLESDDYTYHYISRIIDSNIIIEEENFERLPNIVNPSSKVTTLNDFFSRENNIFKHPKFTKDKNEKNNKNDDEFSKPEFFNDKYISTIHLTGDDHQFKIMKEAYYKKENNIPSLKVDATIITPYTVKSFNNALLEINTFAEKINTDIYSSSITTTNNNTTISSISSSVNTNSTEYEMNNYNDLKSSYFLSFNNSNNTLTTSSSYIDDGGKVHNYVYNSTSIQLLSTSTDNLLLRNKIYMDICNNMGIPTAQVAYSRIYFNNEPLGFYLIKENPNIHYFRQKYETSEMYGQLNSKFSPMVYHNNTFNISNSDPKRLNQEEETDNYANYWYQGQEIPEIAHNKTDLSELFKKFQKPTSLEEINNVFNINDFLKSMALDYVVNNEHAYLYNATNYFLYLDKSSNQWNYHEGYYSSPFNTWDKQSLSLPYNNYRFNRNSTEAMKRPTFDYLISFTDKQFKFENYIEDIIYNYIANGKVFKRMESIYRMIHNDLKWDNLIEINNNNNNNNNKTSQLTKRNNDNNLDFEEEFNNLKNWIKYRGDIDFYKFKIPFNLYSLFTNAFLIAIIFIVIHLLYALFINPIVWFFSDKEVRVLPSTLLKLWCMTLGILMVVGTSLYFWTHDKWKPNLYQVLERQVYNYIINFYGPTSKLDNTVNIILWLIINRENFLILIFAPFVRWPKLKKNQRNSNGNYYKKPNNSETTLNNLLFEDDNSIVNHSINDTTFINCSSSSNSNPSIEIKNTDSQNENKEVRDRIFEEPFDDNDDANEYPCSPTNKNNSSIDEIDVIDILENNPCSPIEPKSYNNSFISNNTMDNDDDDIIAAVAAVAAAVASDDEEEEDDDDTISQMTQSVNERLSIKSSRIEEKNDKVFHSKNIPSYSDEQAEIIGMYKSVRHGFLIVCHNSSDVLPETLKCLLKVTTPMSIFIAENGSCQEEKVKMKEVIDYYSQQYKDTHPNYHGLDIIYANLNEGSKTLAQFCLLNNLYWFGIDIEYISVIDDDVLIPENWKEEEILSYFQDPNVKALAYPITTSNRREGIVPAFQNFEYTLSMYSKKIHRDIGTVVFPSGAIGTWSVPFLLECLYRHDTVFRGEDLQLGIRLHTLYGKPKFCNPNEKHCGNYKIEIAHVSVSTLVPGCYMHLKEYLPHFLGKYLKDCKCGQYSLSRQRIVFWEPARHRFLFKFLDCITHKCKWNHRATLTAKLCCTDFIITIFNDYLFIILFAFLFIKGSYVQALMIICISYALAYLSLDVFNLVIAHGRPDIKLPFEVCVVFPVCYQSVSTFFYRISTIIYTISYYVPFVRNKTKIKKRALKGDISNMTMSEIITNEDSEKAIANVSDIAEYLKNQKKSKKHYLKFNNKHFKHSNNKKLNVKEENEIENEEEDDDNLTYNLDLTEIILDSFDEQSENDDNNTNNNDNDNDNDNNNDNINEIHIIN